MDEKWRTCEHELADTLFGTHVDMVTSKVRGVEEPRLHGKCKHCGTAIAYRLVLAAVGGLPIERLPEFLEKYPPLTDEQKALLLAPS